MRVRTNAEHMQQQQICQHQEKGHKENEENLSPRSPCAWGLGFSAFLCCVVVLLLQAEAAGGSLPSSGDVKATAAALRRWVDTWAEPTYLLLHARVEALAGR